MRREVLVEINKTHCVNLVLMTHRCHTSCHLQKILFGLVSEIINEQQIEKNFLMGVFVIHDMERSISIKQSMEEK